MCRSTRYIMLAMALVSLILSASIMPASAQSQDDKQVFIPLEPGPVVVVLVSGEQLRGELIEDRPGSVKLKVGEVEVRITRDRIQSVYAEVDLMDRYRMLRDSIPDDDADQILFLAEWLRRNDMLDEALLEARSALKIEPSNGEAIRLRQLIEQQIHLRDRARAREAKQKSGESSGDNEPRDPKRKQRNEFPLISVKDANLIKVFEVDLENPPRMIISETAIDALLDQFGGRLGVPATSEGRATFHRKQPVEILEAMYRLRARNLYAEVRVLDLPDSLRIFRDSVNSTWLVNSCATTRCHGSSDAGPLMLANRRPSADQTFLTNLLILERYKLDDGAPMINYDSPESSPLLQMTLPRHESLFPHPKVKGWKPTFTSANSRRFQQAVSWIESMYQPRPEYPIEYTPPVGVVGGAGQGDDAGSSDSSEPIDEPIER